MNASDFISSLSSSKPPEDISILLQSLWYDAKSDWDTAHTLVDELEEPKAYLVHAYLHRKQGDLSNANYWYRRGGKLMPEYSLENEWNDIVNMLIKGNKE
jgi:hypothetical protein